MVHAAGDTGWVAWTNGVDAGLAGKLDAAVASSTYDAGAAKVIHVAESGLDTNSGLIASAPKKTLAAALTAMGTANRGIIQMGLGVIDAGSGTSLSGYRCVLRGMGEGTIVTATAQVGPVIDLSGWLAPNNAQTTVQFSDFQIQGDGTAGVAKKGLRTRAPLEGGFSGTTLRNITASLTGGTPFDYTGAQLCNFENLVASQPVSANANSVPYHYASGATNGNRFVGLGLRSITTDPEGANGCILFESDATYTPDFNLFLAPWFEYLHLPTNGSLFTLQGSLNHIADPQFFDSGKALAGNTGTACIRLSDGAIAGQGNQVTGYLPGTTAGTSIDTGISVEQSGNVIDVIRGYGTNVVTLAAGVARTHAILRGAESTPSGVSFVDNSGTTTNLLIEAWNGAFSIVGGVLKIGSNGLTMSQDGYAIKIGAALNLNGQYVAIGNVGVNGTIALGVAPTAIDRRGLVMTPFSGAQTADLATFNNGSSVSTTAILPLGTLIADDAAKGFVIKDAAATPHYWRVTVSTAGALTTADLGTTRPTS